MPFLSSFAARRPAVNAAPGLSRSARLCAPLIALCLWPVTAPAKPDPEVLNAIRAQGLDRSQVMATFQHLTDRIGPRLTNSPSMREATRWTQQRLQAWGLADVHLEAFEFGRGWSHDQASIDLLVPRKASLHGIPLAWTPGTTGPVEAEVVYLDAVTEAELQKYKGRLRGKVVLLSEAVDIEEPRRELSKRYSLADLNEMKAFDLKAPGSTQPAPEDSIAQRRQAARFSEAREAFIRAEGAAAALFRSSWDGGLVRVMGQNHRVGKTFPVPALMLPAEHYNMLARFLELGLAPRVRLQVTARFHDDDVNAHNVIADIPGRGEQPDIVMLGAQLDSWHGATGGVDNAAGVAITMEAVRILKTVGVQPKRSIRLGLWAGEEQGLHGSLAYVAKHFAARPQPADPAERALSRYLWTSPGWPITTLPDHARLSVYFNVDNGSGRIRGVATEGNAAAKGPFNEWFGHVSDLSEGVVSPNSKGSTDHVSFDMVGLPGFQFIQDPLDYFTRLHHTHIDSFDHALPEDMKQAAVVLAVLAYSAAMAEQRMPRMPLPTAPTAEEEARSKAAADKRSRTKERKALGEMPVRGR